MTTFDDNPYEAPAREESESPESSRRRKIDPMKIAGISALCFALSIIGDDGTIRQGVFAGVAAAISITAMMASLVWWVMQ